MADQNLPQLFIANPVSLDPGDLAYAVKNTGTTPADGALKYSQLMFNRYRIFASVTSGNITLELLHEDGNNPSADRPLYFKIGNALRAITATITVTKNAATNWMNLGAAELATLEHDLFVYVGWNATDGVTLGFSRIPYVRLYGNFSKTSTNERYAAISNIAHAANADDYVNIGRFAATLSGGAGYSWSIPTYTSTNLINFPIFNTRELSFNFSPTGLTVGNSTITMKYVRRDTEVFMHGEVVFGNTTAITGGVSFVPPVTQGTYGAIGTCIGITRFLAAGSSYQGAIQCMTSTSFRFVVASVSAAYSQDTALSSTVPATWTTGDNILFEAHYFGT